MRTVWMTVTTPTTGQPTHRIADCVTGESMCQMTAAAMATTTR